MLLAIDVGNTNTVIALFDGDEVINRWRLSSASKRTADEYAVFLRQLMSESNLKFQSVTDVIISCVVPECLYSFKVLSREYFNCELIVVGDANVSLPISIKLDNPSEIGADRIVNAVAATMKYDGAIIVIDFGTATTFDVINDNKEYLGGAISPGVDLSLDALHAAAAKLPKIAVAKPRQAIGSNTNDAMQSGIYWGYMGLIEGMVQSIKDDFGGTMTVIATGGLSSLYAKESGVIQYIEPDLTIDGLKHIFEINRNNIQQIREMKT